MLTVLMGASGASSDGFWVFLAVSLLGFVLLGLWAVMRLRASGYLAPSADFTRTYPAQSDQDDWRRRDWPHAA